MMSYRKRAGEHRAISSHSPRFPRSSLDFRLLDFRGQPVLAILDDDFADLTQVSTSQHVPRLLHHRVAGVVIGNGEDDAALLDGPDELIGLRSSHSGSGPRAFNTSSGGVSLTSISSSF